MSDINANNTTDSAKNSQMASSLLSQLGSALGGNTSRTKLFASILAQGQNQTSSDNSQAASQAANPKTDRSNSNANNVTAPTNVASNTHTSLTDAWRNVLDRARSHERSHGKAAQSPSSTPATSKASAASKTKAQTQSPAAPASANNSQPSSMIKNTPAKTGAASTSSASPSTSTDDTDSDPSTSDILAQLQALAQYLQKKLQAAQAAGNDDSSSAATQSADAATGTNASATTDDPNAGLSIPDILSQFLALSQQLEKGLQAAQASAAATASSSTATTAAATGAPNLAAIETQLKADLKSLLASLQGDGASADAATTADAAQTATSASTTAALAIPSDMTAAAPKAEDVAKNLLAVSNDFIDLFKNGFGTEAANSSAGNSVFAALNDKEPIASTGDKSGAFLDQDSDGTATTARNASTDAANMGNAVDNSKSASPYSFASQLSATRAASGTTGLPSAVEQVILQMHRNVSSGDDQMTIQLHPADLGKINVKLAISSDGKVQGTVVASNPATLDLLLKDVRSLERALQEAGLRADPGSLQFSLGGQGQSGQSSNQTASDKDNTSAGSDTSTALAAVSADTSETWYVTPGRVNMKV